jgi:hypothetical protein
MCQRLILRLVEMSAWIYEYPKTELPRYSPREIARHAIAHDGHTIGRSIAYFPGLELHDRRF